MDNEKGAVEENVLDKTQDSTAAAGDHRIQFTQPVRPDRARASGKEDASTFIAPSRRSQSVGSIAARRQSIASIPPVLSEKEKARKKREKEGEEKHVDISEHLMSHEDVAEKYKTSISMSKPGESLGLTTAQAEELLLEHGPNILTPPSKRHWILKFWDCLSSLFNLLLILAGFLEYILLGIDFKDNFQNVSLTSILSSDLEGAFVYWCSCLLLTDIFGRHPYRRRVHQCLHRVLPAAKVAGSFGIISQYDSSKVHVYP